MQSIAPYTVGDKVIVWRMKPNGSLTIWDIPGTITVVLGSAISPVVAYVSYRYRVEKGENGYYEDAGINELWSYTPTLMEVFLEAIRTGYPGPIWN